MKDEFIQKAQKYWEDQYIELRRNAGEFIALHFLGVGSAMLVATVAQSVFVDLACAGVAAVCIGKIVGLTRRHTYVRSSIFAWNLVSTRRKKTVDDFYS